MVMAFRIFKRKRDFKAASVTEALNLTTVLNIDVRVDANYEQKRN